MGTGVRNKAGSAGSSQGTDALHLPLLAFGVTCQPWERRSISLIHDTGNWLCPGTQDRPTGVNVGLHSEELQTLLLLVTRPPQLRRAFSSLLSW